MTKEDVLPRWLSRILKQETGATHFMIDSSRGQWEPGILNLQARVVCKKECNSGWMARMEDRSKPVLSQYVLAEHPKVILPPSQELLAAWAYKTFLMLTAWEDPHLIPRAEYQRFYEERTPGNGALVWMGAYGGNRHAARFRLKAGELVGGGRKFDSPYNSIAAVFNVFRAVFVVFRWLGNRVVGEDVTYTDPANKLGRIWPSTGPFLRWPPDLAFTEDEYVSYELIVE